MNIFKPISWVVPCCIAANLIPAPAKAIILLENPRIEVTVNPGGSVTETFNIGNIGTVPTALTLQVKDWRQANANDLEILEPGTNPYSSAPWVQVTPQQGVLQPNQLQVARLRVQVPKNAQPGDWTAYIVANERPILPPAAPGESRISTGFSSGVVLYVRIAPLQPAFDISSMKLITQKSNVNPQETLNQSMIEVTLNNTQGNTRVRASGEFVIINKAGEQVYKQDILAWVVTRNHQAKYNVLIKPNLPPGEYEARVTLKPSEEEKNYTGRLPFTILP